MKFSKTAMMVVAPFVLMASAALAQTATTSTAGKRVPPTPQQMEAVRACAAAKGVEMPDPPGPPPGKGAGNMTADQAQGDAQKAPPPRPRLTAEQKAIVDACFKEEGLSPPPRGKMNKKGGKGPAKGMTAPPAEAAPPAESTEAPPMDE